jgi:hypothetical protein
MSLREIVFSTRAGSREGVDMVRFDRIVIEQGSDCLGPRGLPSLFGVLLSAIETAVLEKTSFGALRGTDRCVNVLWNCLYRRNTVVSRYREGRGSLCPMLNHPEMVSEVEEVIIFP